MQNEYPREGGDLLFEGIRECATEMVGFSSLCSVTMGYDYSYIP